MAQICSGYISEALEPQSRKKIVERAVKRLRSLRKKFPFKAIALRGFSGSLVAPAVADRLGVPLIVVRKPTEKSHAMYKVEGAIYEKYVIVDDFVFTGETILEIMSVIQDERDRMTPPQKRDPNCVGVYLWLRSATSGSTKKQTEEMIAGTPCLNTGFYKP